ncbi:MAG: hypothetical protein J6I50_09090 [Clostridia bacterium]|nr:hypothetical protein [Clostridia bacterium]
MPDIVKCGDGDQYIGYEDIGEAYSGNRKYIIEEDALLAAVVSDFTSDGVFLDLACGDSCLTVSCAANGMHIIYAMMKSYMLSTPNIGNSLMYMILSRKNTVGVLIVLPYAINFSVKRRRN